MVTGPATPCRCIASEQLPPKPPGVPARPPPKRSPPSRRVAPLTGGSLPRGAHRPSRRRRFPRTDVATTGIRTRPPTPDSAAVQESVQMYRFRLYKLMEAPKLSWRLASPLTARRPSPNKPLSLLLPATPGASRSRTGCSPNPKPRLPFRQQAPAASENRPPALPRLPECPRPDP